jgi:hypothetical protein
MHEELGAKRRRSRTKLLLPRCIEHPATKHNARNTSLETQARTKKSRFATRRDDRRTRLQIEEFFDLRKPCA